MASARQVKHVAEYSPLRVASCALSKEEDLSCHQILKGGLRFERKLPGFVCIYNRYLLELWVCFRLPEHHLTIC